MTTRQEAMDTQSLPVENVKRKAILPGTVQRKVKEKTRSQKAVVMTRTNGHHLTIFLHLRMASLKWRNWMMSNVPGVINASDGPRVRRSMAQHSTRHDKRYKLLKPIWLAATVTTNSMTDYEWPRVFTKPGMAVSTQHVEQHFPVLTLRPIKGHKMHNGVCYHDSLHHWADLQALQQHLRWWQE